MATIALLAAALLLGAITGVLALVVLAIHRENRNSLPVQAPSRATAAARSLMGLRVGGTGPAAHAGLPATPTQDEVSTS